MNVGGRKGNSFGTHERGYSGGPTFCAEQDPRKRERGSVCAGAQVGDTFLLSVP